MKTNSQHNREPVLLLGTRRVDHQPILLTGPAFAQHKWVQGISGSGKSTFLAWMALSLLRERIAFSVIDPHGDLCRLILSLLASSDFFTNPKAFEMLWFVDFARPDKAPPFNVLQQPYESHTIASNLLEAMHRAFPTSGTTAMLDNMLLAAAFVLAEHGNPVTDLQQLLLDQAYRDSLMLSVSDPLIKQFFAMKFGEKTSSQLIDSTLRRSFLLTFSPSLNHSLGQRENKLNFRDLMDNQVSCLFSLGGLDDQSKRLLGCLLMVGLEQAFLSRATLSPHKRFPYHVLVDEFPLFVASGDSFSILLEQVRKYAGSLILANQTYSQLSKELLGSLQNAIPILMKAGSDDSSALANRFYRSLPSEDAATGTPRSMLSAFAQCTTTSQARAVFETLKRQEALVSIETQMYKILTPTLPITQDEVTLKPIEEAYASLLLRSPTTAPSPPLEIVAASHRLEAELVVDASPPPDPKTTPKAPYAMRRTRRIEEAVPEPFRLTTGVLDMDILSCLYHFHYLTLHQIATLLQKEKSINYLREKLKKLITQEMVESMLLARTTSGKPPTVYTLTTTGAKHLTEEKGLPAPQPTGPKAHGYLEHTLECNELLIAAFLLPTLKPTITLADLKHERTLKTNPIMVAQGRYVIPDGMVKLFLNYEAIGICVEIDRGTEEREKIQQKIKNYVSFAQGPYQRTFSMESLSIIFCVTKGDEARVKQLLTWTEQILEDAKTAAPLFLVGKVTLGEVSPEQVFSDRLFHSPYDKSMHAIIEEDP